MPPSQADGDGSEGGGGGTGVGGHAEDGADGRVNNSPRQPHPQPRRHSHHRSHHHHSPRLGGDTGDGGGGHPSSSTPPQPPPPPPRPSALVVVAGPPTPPPPAPPPPLRYTRLSQFTHRVEIYRGAVSAVHRAACARTGARVVLKCYHRAAMTERHRHKLGREVAAMRALRGPHVASLLARFDDAEAGESVLVLEHCEGGDLFKAMLKAGGSLPEQWVAVEAVAPLLRLLEKAAALGFLHRDIKPENLFLTASGRLRVGDFGLAIQAREELPFSRSGTLDYMAPEVLLNPPLPSLREGEAGADAAALRAHGVVPYGPGVDVWAAGILAYELVLGRAPYEVPDDEAATAALIARGDAAPRFPGEPLYCSADASAPAGSLGAPAPSPRALLVPGPATGGPLPSAQWRAFVRAALTKDPAQRPTAAQLLRHPWLEGHLRRAAAADGRRRASLEALLLEPLALGPGAAGGGGSAAGAGGGAASGGVGGGGGGSGGGWEGEASAAAAAAQQQLQHTQQQQQQLAHHFTSDGGGATLPPSAQRLQAHPPLPMLNDPAPLSPSPSLSPRVAAGGGGGGWRPAAVSLPGALVGSRSMGGGLGFGGGGGGRLRAAAAAVLAKGGGGKQHQQQQPQQPAAASPRASGVGGSGSASALSPLSPASPRQQLQQHQRCASMVRFAAGNLSVSLPPSPHGRDRAAAAAASDAAAASSSAASAASGAATPAFAGPGSARSAPGPPPTSPSSSGGGGGAPKSGIRERVKSYFRGQQQSTALGSPRAGGGVGSGLGGDAGAAPDSGERGW